MAKFFLLAGAIGGFLSVAIGAFGAHALRETLTTHGRTDTFELAVKYQFYHSLALLVVGILMHVFKTNALSSAGYSFIAGIGIFSGSLYALSLTNIGKFGAITPIGGVCLLLGWGLLAWNIYKQ